MLATAAGLCGVKTMKTTTLLAPPHLARHVFLFSTSIFDDIHFYRWNSRLIDRHFNGSGYSFDCLRFFCLWLARLVFSRPVPILLFLFCYYGGGGRKRSVYLLREGWFNRSNKQRSRCLEHKKKIHICDVVTPTENWMDLFFFSVESVRDSPQCSASGLR